MANLLRGSRGQEVRELQQALNRQLHPSPNLIVDGIFGAQTEAAVTAFQRQAGISIDGIAGPETKSALGMSITGNAYTHQVRLHFRSLTLTDVSFNRILASTQEVYARHGIKIAYGSGESLNLTPAQANRFKRVDGTCTWKIETGEYADLQTLGSPAPANDVVVYFVEDFSESINGCGGHLQNRPACVVSKDGTRWCTAHEVCHVLLTSSFSPVHITDRTNLMHPVDIQRTVPTLTPAQVRQIKASPLCHAI